MSALKFCIALGLFVLASLYNGCGERESVPHIPAARSDFLLQRGSEAVRQHDFLGALQLVDSADIVDPLNANVSFLRARIYSELGRWDEAETAYHETLRRQADYRGVWNNLANNAYRQAEYEHAIRLYRKELELLPAARPWRGMGRSYIELGKVDSAETAFLKAIEYDSSYSPAHLSLTFLYEDEGEFDKALEHARRALAISPDNNEYKYLVGSLYVKTGKPEGGIELLREVVKEWPWHHGAHYNLGQGLVRTGQLDQGRKYLEKAERVRARHAKIEHLENTVRSVPDDPIAHAALGSELRMAGRYNDAMHAYKVALHLAPANIEIRNNIANLSLIRGDTTLAIQQYEEIVAMNPQLAEIWLNLGIVYAIAGESSKARAAWNRVLQLKPGNPAATAYLARLDREEK